MRQRKGETDEAFKARRAAYDARRWKETKRTRNRDGEITSVTETRRGRNPKKAAKIPHGIIARTSTLYDRDNRVTAQWVIEKPEDRARIEAIELMARALAEKLPRVAPLPFTGTDADDTLTVYGIGDQHHGMLSWKKETGGDWDLDISERRLIGAMEHLAQSAPAGGTALVASVGDYFHYDSMVAITPKSGHNLDADSRPQKMLMSGVRMFRECVEIARHRHNQVRVIAQPGNHDPILSTALGIMFHFMYENDPQVTVDISPSNFRYFHWGANLIGVTHGDGIKLEDLASIMADDQPEAWAASKCRVWFTGHRHHKLRLGLRGCSVEVMKILAPNDAYAAKHGYRSERGMEAIVYARRGGRIGTHEIDPRMLEQP